MKMTRILCSVSWIIIITITNVLIVTNALRKKPITFLPGTLRVCCPEFVKAEIDCITAHSRSIGTQWFWYFVVSHHYLFPLLFSFLQGYTDEECRIFQFSMHFVSKKLDLLKMYKIYDYSLGKQKLKHCSFYCILEVEDTGRCITPIELLLLERPRYHPDTASLPQQGIYPQSETHCSRKCPLILRKKAESIITRTRFDPVPPLRFLILSRFSIS